jgi:hypothetical protein
MSASARKAKGALICGAVTLAVLLVGCTSTAEPQATASPTGGQQSQRVVFACRITNVQFGVS